MPKMGQSASKVSLDEPKWAHLEPLLHTLMTFLSFCAIIIILKAICLSFMGFPCIFRKNAQLFHKNA